MCYSFLHSKHFILFFSYVLSFLCFAITFAFHSFVSFHSSIFYSFDPNMPYMFSSLEPTLLYQSNRSSLVFAEIPWISYLSKCSWAFWDNRKTKLGLETARTTSEGGPARGKRAGASFLSCERCSANGQEMDPGSKIKDLHLGSLQLLFRD